MLFNTTYKNEEYDIESAALVGKPFRLFERLKQGGIGSGRLMIHEMSSKLNLGKLKFSEVDYGNMELRPQGIIVHYTQKNERFAWVIPYYRLVIYSTEFFTIHADGNFIQFLKNKNYKENKKFIRKMMDKKNDFLELGYYEG